jgi:hypothetical protein
MNPVTRETPTVTDLEGWSQFPKSLLVTLSDEPSNLEFNTRLHRGDALCVLEEEDPEHVPAGTFISPEHLKIDIIQDWLSSCDKLHSAQCRPAWTQELPHIKLVDASTREIVQPAERSFDYLALSYVCGGVEQGSYHHGSKLGNLPQTIEDAIQLMHALGKPCLWVDSLCIDQADDDDKKRQIITMKDIYSGA